jgi:O-antigen ligase
MAFFGVFARGLVNLSFGALFVWGVLFLIYHREWLLQPSPPIPRLCLESMAFFIGICVLTSITGIAPLRSLAHTGDLVFQLSVFPLTWLALGQYPSVRRLTPLLYAFGLMVCALMTFKEAGWGLVCVRAKAHLGVIELGAVLGQLAPIMVGALALSLRKSQKWRTAIFLASLLASFVALRVSCARIALIAAPILSILVFLANWRAFRWKSKVVALLVFGLAVLSVMMDQTTVGRFLEMGVAQGNLNNEMRKTQWIQGLKVFRENPVLGSGPGAVPSPPPELLPRLPNGAPLLVWKPYSPSHNAFIDVMAGSGLFGLIGFLALHLAPLLLIGKNLLNRDPEILFWSWSAVAVAGQFVLNGMTDQIFGLRPLMYIYWTTTAIALWLPAYKRPVDQGGARSAKSR